MKNILIKRAQLLKELRSFFYSRHFLECDVPLLGQSTVTDPFIDSIEVQMNKKEFYLQTSPEYFLKKLLAQGVGDCFYLGKAFRYNENGRHHNSEFTLCEWYWLNHNEHMLMDQIMDLFKCLCEVFDCEERLKMNKISYGELFYRYTNINPYNAELSTLKKYAHEKISIGFDDPHINTWLDCIFTHLIEPTLDNITFVYDYPASQSALARLGVNQQGEAVAKRFEVFWKKKELANGYWELTCAHEQAQRFLKDNKMRTQLNKKTILPDNELLKAMEQGLPHCAGVALGVDRLLMCLLDKEHINQVMPFCLTY